MSKPLGGRVERTLASFESEGICMELASHIKEHRGRLGMSQEDLAEAIFVSRQTISNWENDRTYPDVQSLLLLSNLFEVSVDSLVKGDVKEMKATLAAEAKKMNRLTVVMLAFGIAALVWAFAAAIMDLDLVAIVVPAIVLFVPALIAGTIIEKMKHDNQLFTYQAVEAFLTGEDPDVLSKGNQRAGQHWVRKRIVGTIIAMLIGACCGWGAISIIMTLLG